MRLFSFFKRTPSKTEEAEEVKLASLSEWLNSLRENALQAATQSLLEIKNSISAEKTSINENLRILMDTELKNASIPERAKQIRESNRTTYVQKVKALVEEINVPEEFDKLIEFCDAFDAALTQFSTTTMRNYAILQQFFDNESSSLAINLRKLDSLVKSIRKVVTDSQLDKLAELETSVNKLQQKIRQKQDSEEKIKLIEKELEAEHKNSKQEQSKLDELEQTSAHRHFIDLLDTQQQQEMMLEDLKTQMFHSFSVINAALKKFERLTLQDELVRAYLDDFLKALLLDTHLKIAELLEKMEVLISKNELELNEKKKDKILQELSMLDKAYFEAFLNKYHTLQKKLAEMTSEIEKSDIAKQIENINSLLRQSDYRIEESTHKLQQKKEEVEGISIENLSKGLESEIKIKLGKEIKIIL